MVNNFAFFLHDPSVLIVAFLVTAEQKIMNKLHLVDNINET